MRTLSSAQFGSGLERGSTVLHEEVSFFKREVRFGILLLSSGVTANLVCSVDQFQ